MRLILVLAGSLSLLGLWVLSPSQSLVDNNLNLKSALRAQATTSTSGSSADKVLINPALKTSSLKGTDIDGMYPVDESGNLLFSKSIKYRFEYFLSTLGEFPLEQVLQMVRDDIQLNLQDPARQQALALFDDYIAYKYALAELEGSFEAGASYESQDIQKLRFQLQQLRDKRREYLPSEAVDAFFGFDELYDDFVLTSLEIKHSQQLTAQEKHQQLKSLEQSLPSDVQQMRDETTRISHVFKLTQEMKEQGASEDDIFEYNSQKFGQQAAERLKVLDKNRQTWQLKVQNFLVAKQAIEAQDELSDIEKTDKINVLKSDQFSQQEQARLPAFELMHKE